MVGRREKRRRRRKRMKEAEREDIRRKDERKIDLRRWDKEVEPLRPPIKKTKSPTATTAEPKQATGMLALVVHWLVAGSKASTRLKEVPESGSFPPKTNRRPLATTPEVSERKEDISLLPSHTMR